MIENQPGKTLFAAGEQFSAAELSIVQVQADLFHRWLARRCRRSSMQPVKKASDQALQKTNFQAMILQNLECIVVTLDEIEQKMIQCEN
jgi:hypothetical protein